MNEEKPSVGEVVKDALTQPLKAPFTNEALNPAKNQGHVVNTTRIVEAVIIAALSSLCTSITMVPRLEERIASQSKEIQEIRTQIDAMRRDFYIPFGRQTMNISKGPSDG